MTFFSGYFLHIANKYISTRFEAKYLLIKIYYSCCAITYLPRPHTWLAYRKVIIARIVTTYWHIFPEKTQNTLKIWFDSNEAYTGIMSAGQKACNSKTIFFIPVWSIFAQGSFFLNVLFKISRCNWNLWCRTYFGQSKTWKAYYFFRWSYPMSIRLPRGRVV